MAESGGTPHGSARGYESGCRSRGGCRHHDSPEMLTCVEAWIARRSDFALRGVPEWVPLLRNDGGTPLPVPTEAHGTIWGYRRGCRRSEGCPARFSGRPTCADARRAYMQGYGSRRLAGRGAPVAHGTSNGYLLGCRDAADCPGGPDGLDCVTARRNLRRARTDTLDAPAAPADARRAAAVVRRSVSEGVSVREIARRTGCGRATIARLAAAGDDDSPRITRRTHRRILDDISTRT